MKIIATEKFSRFDAADQLKTEEDIIAYLDAVIEDAGEDPAIIVRALGTVARARNMSQLARDAGMTRQGLYKALSGEGNPSLGTILKAARVLGLRLTFSDAKSSTPGRSPERTEAVARSGSSTGRARAMTASSRPPRT